MNSSLPPIKDLLVQTESWGLYDENTFIAYNCLLYGEEIHVPASYLKGAHPDFPDALRASIHWRVKEEKDPTVSGCLAYDTYKLARGDVIELERTSGRTLYFEYIDKLAVNLDNTDTVFISGEHLSVIIENNKEKDVSFVVSSGHTVIAIERTPLDSKYPEWEKKYQIATDLGLIGDELVEHVFKKDEPHISTSIDITFE